MSTRSTIVTAALTALITSIGTFFVLDYIKQARNRPKEVLVPQLVGLKPSQAMEVLDGRKLRLQIIERRADAKIPVGQVCSQHPLADSKVMTHSAINVVLSSGPPKITIPPCLGITLQRYTTQLTQAKLKLGTVGYGASKNHKPGEVIACDPKPGTVVRPGATVALTVAKKPDPAREVPKLKGTSCRRAKEAIVKAGFTVGKVKWRSFDAPPYLVMRQSPDPKTKALPGAPIDLTCSKDD